jgi:hypothetical protein
MKHIKLFENWTPQTASGQKIRISAPDSHGEIVMTGYLSEGNGKYYFIPEKNGYGWIKKDYHTPSYAVSLKSKFDELVGKKLEISVGDRGFGEAVKIDGKYNWDAEVWIEGLLFGQEGLKFEFI